MKESERWKNGVGNGKMESVVGRSARWEEGTVPQITGSNPGQQGKEPTGRGHAHHLGASQDCGEAKEQTSYKA